jgi:hypothetical protein
MVTAAKPPLAKDPLNDFGNVWQREHFRYDDDRTCCRYIFSTDRERRV